MERFHSLDQVSKYFQWRVFFDKDGKGPLTRSSQLSTSSGGFSSERAFHSLFSIFFGGEWGLQNLSLRFDIIYDSQTQCISALRFLEKQLSSRIKFNLVITVRSTSSGGFSTVENTKFVHLNLTWISQNFSIC